MKLSFSLLAMLVVAACSGPSSPVEPNPSTDDDTRNGPASRSVGPNPSDSTLTEASNLHASVSALNGTVSGLNTRLTKMGLIIDLPADALFDYDKASLTPSAEVQLRKAAEVIRQSPPGSIRVIGHTDGHGGDEYNKKLSEARARTVAEWFGQQVGVRLRAYDVSGRGETEPIVPNTNQDGSDNPTGRAKNRRVEVIIPSSGS